MKKIVGMYVYNFRVYTFTKQILYEMMIAERLQGRLAECRNVNQDAANSIYELIREGSLQVWTIRDKISGEIDREEEGEGKKKNNYSIHCISNTRDITIKNSTQYK